MYQLSDPIRQSLGLPTDQRMWRQLEPAQVPQWFGPGMEAWIRSEMAQRRKDRQEARDAEFEAFVSRLNAAGALVEDSPGIFHVTGASGEIIATGPLGYLFGLWKGQGQ